MHMWPQQCWQHKDNHSHLSQHFFEKKKFSKRKKETRQQQIKPPQGWLVPVKTVQTKLILARRRVPNKVIRAHDELIQRATRLYYLKLVPIQRYSSGWQANQEMKKNYPPFSWEWASSTIHLPPLHTCWRHHVFGVDLSYICRQWAPRDLFYLSIIVLRCHKNEVKHLWNLSPSHFWQCNL